MTLMDVASKVKKAADRFTERLLRAKKIRSTAKVAVRTRESREPFSVAAWAKAAGGDASALFDEWMIIAQDAGKDPELRLSMSVMDTKTLYVVSCANGTHMSSVSHVKALKDLVDAQRVGVEDTGATRDLVWWAESDKAAHKVLSAIAEGVRAEMPMASGIERDAAILARLSAMDEKEAAHHGLEKTDQTTRRKLAAEAIAAKRPRLAEVRDVAGAAVPLEAALLRSANDKESKRIK